MMCALAQSREGMDKVKAAIRASPNSGLREQDARRMVSQGQQMFGDYKISHGKRMDTWDAGTYAYCSLTVASMQNLMF